MQHVTPQPSPETSHSPHPASSHAATRGRSLGSLLKSLSQEVATLLSKESELARAELRDKLDQVGSGASELGAGALVTFAGFLVLLASAVLGLRFVMPLWLGALVVGGTVFLIGLLLLARARSNLKAENLTPDRTLHSMQRDVDLAREAGEKVRSNTPTTATGPDASRGSF